MYVSWNHSADLLVRYSTDNGLTWTNERQLKHLIHPQRAAQPVTWSRATCTLRAWTKVVAAAAALESNKIYRSTDGGNTWANTYTGPTFVGACRGNVGYFATMYSNPAYWRHMGWGEARRL